jgi:hypothetical protein
MARRCRTAVGCSAAAKEVDVLVARTNVAMAVIRAVFLISSVLPGNEYLVFL